MWASYCGKRLETTSPEQTRPAAGTGPAAIRSFGKEKEKPLSPLGRLKRNPGFPPAGVLVHSDLDGTIGPS